jgi:cytoskeletal protein CcmA (bactofilin family)
MRVISWIPGEGSPEHPLRRVGRTNHACALEERSMERTAAVGSSVVIKGQLSAQEDVVIAGRVEGTVSVEGHLVVVEPGGHVAADVVAKGIVVAGNVNGSLAADERIELRSSARVEGELTAPRIAIAEGAVLCGKVETSGARAGKASLKAAS